MISIYGAEVIRWRPPTTSSRRSDRNATMRTSMGHGEVLVLTFISPLSLLLCFPTSNSKYQSQVFHIPMPISASTCTKEDITLLLVAHQGSSRSLELVQGDAVIKCLDNDNSIPLVERQCILPADQQLHFPVAQSWNRLREQQCRSLD